MNIIAALATSPSASSALNIIRLSGDGVFAVVLSAFRTASQKKLRQFSHKQAEYGYFIHPQSGDIIDEVILLPFFAPHSYTGEDSVEINCHGGHLLYKRILDVLASFGVRHAEAGEFTKRAVLNGKMDISQAEAVQEVVSAENNLLLSLAQKNLMGSFKKELASVSEPLFELITLFEANINFSDEVNAEVPPELFSSLIDAVQSLLSSGAYIDDLHLENILILGEPNVGKSSLMNLLCGKEKSIVTDISGTTRDMIEQKVEIAGFHATLIDTAGLKEETKDIIEAKGIEKALEMIPRSGIVLYLIDAGKPFNKEGFLQVYQNISRHSHLSFIICVNKTDLNPSFDFSPLYALLTQREHVSLLSLSVKKKQNIEKLKEEIKKKMALSESLFDKAYYINKRQKSLMESALQLIKEAQNCYTSGESEEITLQLLHEASGELSLITGKMTTEEMLGNIFSGFCIGK